MSVCYSNFNKTKTLLFYDILGSSIPTLSIGELVYIALMGHKSF